MLSGHWMGGSAVWVAVGTATAAVVAVGVVVALAAVVVWTDFLVSAPASHDALAPLRNARQCEAAVTEISAESWLDRTPPAGRRAAE